MYNLDMNENRAIVPVSEVQDSSASKRESVRYENQKTGVISVPSERVRQTPVSDKPFDYSRIEQMDYATLVEQIYRLEKTRLGKDEDVLMSVGRKATDPNVLMLQARIEELDNKARDLEAESVVNNIVSDALASFDGKRRAFTPEDVRNAITRQAEKAVKTEVGFMNLKRSDAQLVEAYVVNHSLRMADLAWAQMRIVKSVRQNVMPREVDFNILEKNLPHLDKEGRLVDAVDFSAVPALAQNHFDWKKLLGEFERRAFEDPKKMFEALKPIVGKPLHADISKETTSSERASFSSMKFDELQRILQTDSSDKNLRRVVLEEKRQRARELSEYVAKITGTPGELERQVANTIQDYLTKKVFLDDLSGLQSMLENSFQLPVALPVDMEERYGGLAQQLYKDEAANVIYRLQRSFKDLSNAEKTMYDLSALKQLSWNVDSLRQGYVGLNVSYSEDPIRSLYAYPKTDAERQAYLATINDPQERSDMERRLEMIRRLGDKRELYERRAKQVTMLRGTTLESAANLQGKISLEDASLIINADTPPNSTGEDPAERAKSRIHDLLDMFWNSPEQSKRIYARGALEEFVKFMGSNNSLSILRKEGEIVSDALKFYVARETSREFGQSNDAKGKAELIQVNDQFMNLFSGEAESGETRLKTWFSDTMKYLTALDQVPNYWEDRFLETNKEEIDPAVSGDLVEVKRRLDAVRAQIEPDSVKRAMMDSILEIWGVYGERGRKKFDANYYGNISYTQNPERYLGSKRGKTLVYSADPRVTRMIEEADSLKESMSSSEYDEWVRTHSKADQRYLNSASILAYMEEKQSGNLKVKIEAIERILPQVKKLNIPPLVGSFPSYLMWKHRNLPKGEVCRDKFLEQDAADLYADPGSFKEWMTVLTKATGSMQGIEDFVNKPSVDGYVKLISSGLSHLFSTYNHEEDGLDLSGRTSKKTGGQFRYGDRRKAMLIEFGVFMFAKEFANNREAWAKQLREGKNAPLSEVNDVNIKQEILRAVEVKLRESSSNLLGSNFMKDLKYILIYEGLYPSKARQDAADAWTATANVRSDIGKHLGNIFKS